MPPPATRHIDELLLAAGDVAVVDRATLSLWHIQQLLRPHLTPAQAPLEADDKENATTNQDAAALVAAPAPTTVELEDGMTVAAVAFAEPTDGENDPHETMAATTTEPELPVALPPSGGNEAASGVRTWRMRRASITESEISVDDDAEPLATFLPQAHVSMATQVALVYRRYRCVLCLDASPSALAIDVHSGKVFLEMLYDSVDLFVRNLLRPVEVGGTPFVPEFHVSVMVQGAYVESLCVLVQGFVLDLSNADRLLQLVHERLTLLEDEWAAAARSDHRLSEASKQRASLSSVLQNAVFALHSLPSGAAPLIVLATDGVVDLHDAYTYDSLVMQLVRHDIQCHFLRIGGSPWQDPHASFGFVPDIELLDFLAQASSGSVIEYISLHQSWAAPPARDRVKCMTPLQSSLLVRPSKVQAISAPVLKLDMAWCASFDGNQYMPLRPYRMWREKVHEYRIQTDVHHIVEARVREGFAVNKVHVRTMQRLADGSFVNMPVAPLPIESVPSHGSGTKILLVFVLQWKQNVWLEYVISTTIDHQSQGRTPASSRSTTKTVSGSASVHPSSSKDKKDPAASEWYVKVNVLADAEFLRAFADCRANRQGRQDNVEAAGSPTALHDFIRNVQDVDRVLLHLMTAAASAISATDTPSHFSFGSQANTMVSPAASKNQSSHPVFGIIGELSPVLWHRWFHVDRFEVLAVVVDDPSPQSFYPRGVAPQVVPRNSAMGPLRSLPTARLRQGRRAGMSLEANAHPLLVGKDFTVERIRGAILRWSSQRLGKDLFLRFLSTDSQRTEERSKPMAATPTSSLPKRRQQRSSLNSATLAAQINASMEQMQLQPRREERSKGALCFVRVEAKNHTLVVIHVAFFAASASTRRETLVELKSIVGTNDAQPSTSQGTTGGMMLPPTSSSNTSRKLVLVHRLLSRLLVTHETLALQDTDSVPESFFDQDKPMVACCGGSELRLRSVFGAFMWHSSWKWRLARTSTTSLTDVMRHLHEARIRAGFWVLDWTMEEDGESMRIASVIFGREILMEDENGHLKTSLVQYGITRTADNCLLTSFWMEPQYGFAKTTVARDATMPGQHDVLHSSLRHAVGHDAPLSKLAAGSLQIPTADGSAEGATTYLDEGKLLGLIRDFLFDADRHLLSCLHTFETVTGVQESGVDSVAQRYAIPRAPGIIGLPTEDETLQGSSSLVPAFSTARLLEASTRSSEHFLMYLERNVSSSLEANETAAIPALSSANIYLYSMLERTLRSLSDCEVAWTDFDGCVVGDTLERTTDSRMSAIASQLPLWFARFDSVMPESVDRQLSLGRCFAKLLPNDTVVFSFLPAISTLARKRRPMLSPIETTDKTISRRQAGLARWDQRHQLKTAASAEVTEQQAAAAQSSMLKMSVSADDIVLYQERRQSFREGYKSWRMGHFQGSKDDKTHRAGHGGPLSPHPKVASFSEDYEFCESICRDAALGGDFHLLIEKADGELGSGYFQVAFYECSLAQLTATLTTQPCYRQREAREALLTQLFAHRAVGELVVEADRTPQLTKRGATSTFGSRAGLGIPPPSPISIPVEPARDESPQVLAVLHSSMTFRKKVKRAHEHNFSRGIYVALRDGAPVEQSDLIQALSSCVEVPLDMDITLLYRMLQVDMIRETVPRSALRSSMIDMLSGKPIRDALKERLDKSLEDILSAVFHGIADTKYFVFVGSENLAVDDVAGGGADTEGDTVQLLEEEDLIGENEGMPSKPPRLVKSITIASDSGGFGPLAAHGDGGDYERVASSENITLDFGGMSASIEAGESALHDLVDHQHQQQINQEEDAELNKDVAAATSSFSSPFFFRFECRELVKDLVPGTRPRSTSSGMNSFELRALPPKSIVPRSASTMGNSGSRTSQGAVALLQNKSTDSSGTDGTDGAVKGGPTGGVSEIAEWAAKLSGPKIALRLVTLTLPNEQLLERTRGSHMGVEVEDQRQKVTPAELFSSLPLFQRHVLKRLRKRIKEWSSMEILRILRNVESITPEISQLVQKLFRALPDDCRTTVKYPISFVDVQHETVDPLALLEKELRLGTDSLQLIDGGGPYFVVNRLSEASYTVPYWAFLTVEKDHIVLQLHHQPADGGMVAPFDRLTVLTSLHLAVNDVCKRVNQFLLLLQLHETRSCNELLLPADPGTASAGPPSPTLASQQRLSDSSPRPFFWPGQFECDRKYAAFFRLHERMTPSIALTTLCTQALEQFEVHNRRHVFVYRDRGGHVFYMKMSVATSDALSQPATPSNLRRSTGSTAGDSSITVPSGILLEVFGVSTAGEEVTQELCRLLERKLDEIMQLILMKLLARNTKFQLSSSDLAFMCPPDSSPASSIVYKMPSGLVPRSDASTTLLFLCQTLGMTAYIRQLNTSPQSQLTQAMVQGRYERQSSTRSVTNGRGGVQAETANTEPASDVHPIDVETGRLTVVNDASVFHPALFGQEEKLSSGFVESISSSDATATSPIFFSRSSGGVKQPPSDQETVVAPVVLGHATFAVNLNSELRLSPGFLSRVGKGLAILRVEFLHCEDGNMVVEDGSEMTSLDVGHTFRAVSSDTVVDNLSTLFVRCQLWVRGPIQVPAFRSVYEAHLRESICDYAIEATIRHVRQKPALVDDEGDKTANTKMPQPVGVLVDLLEASAQMSSTSVTKLSLPVAIQSWDVANIVSQVHKFLTASLPVHARPAIFSGAHGSVFVRVDGTNELRSQSHDHVKLIPTPPAVDYGTASSSTLAKSDSIQSEMSDMDSVSSFRYSIGSSTIESLNSTSIHTGSASSLVSIKEFATSELMFHSMAKGAGAETAKRSAPPVVQQRSFYYLISVSVTDGLVFHGYNLSQQVVDAIAMQFARVMTWCLLRDRMLQGLLLQRGGVGYAAPSGASVVQPRLLLSNGGALHATEFSLSYVAFQTTMVPILQAFDLVPKSVETTTYRLDLTPFGKLLKELGVQIVDKSDLQRTRSRNLAPSRPASDDAMSSTGRIPGAMRSGILSSSSSQRTMGGAGIEKTPPPRPGTGTTVASPTKRGSTGGLLTPALSIGPSSGSSQQARSGGPGGSNAANAARMQRSNPTAANALMAARARARGGGFPGKMGGGPGVGSSRAAGEVAPWDLPVTNTKVNTTASSVGNPPRQPDVSAGRSTMSAIPPTPVLGRVGSNGAGTVGVPKRPSGSQATLGVMGATAGRPAFDRKGGTKANAWRSILVETWGPHAKYYCRNEKTTCKEPTEETSRGRAIDPLRHYAAAFQRQLQLTTASSAASDGSMALFRLIQETPIDVASLDVADDKHLQTMLQTGHVMFHQRFRVSFIERWQIVKIDDEYVEDGSNTGRLRALQASMDLVNLLSYKQEFVFGGNERVVAKLLTEHTVQAMCGKEGQAVREMKLQILKAVFHSRMDVVHRFFEQYATHLRSLGFLHLQLASSRLARKQQASSSSATTTPTAAAGNGSGSGSGSATPSRSSVDAFASGDEAFSEFFVHRGGMVTKMTKSGVRGAPSTPAQKDLLVLELKCDHTGVQVSVVLLNDQDLKQQQLGHQRHLDRTQNEVTTTPGEVVRQVSKSLRDTLDTRMLIHDFTIRFFHRCLLDWTLNKPGTTSSLHNMVRGVRCFLRSYPRSPSEKAKSDCALEAATVELPVRNLQSDFSESILVKILLRYIACHGSRYDVTDLTQFGTPDTIACHSAAGNFFSRQNAGGVLSSSSASVSSSWNRGGTASPPGYSLLITTQELWKGQKRPKNSVLLALVRSTPSSAILLRTDRAMQEAELYVKELFRAAAANYERDLLWSRLLHNDCQGPSADVAHALALPVEYFRVEVGPQQLEECLRLSVCIPLQQIDPELNELLEMEDVCWQEFALRLRDVYAGQVREYQFEGQAACHFLLLCPDARDLMIHLTFPSGITSATVEGDATNRVQIAICRREEPANHKFTLPQRRAITDFVNSVVHWLWRCLLYD